MTQVGLKKGMSVAYAIKQIGVKDRWEYLEALDTLFKQNEMTKFEPSEWYFGLSKMQKAFEEPLTGRGSSFRDPHRARLDRFYDLVGTTHPLVGIVTDNIRKILKVESSQQELTLFSQEAADKGRIYNDYYPRAHEIIGKAYDLAETDEVFATYWNTYVARDLGNFNQTPEMFIEMDPSLDIIYNAYTGGDAAKIEAAKVEIERALEENSVKVVDGLAALTNELEVQRGLIGRQQADIDSIAEYVESERVREKQSFELDTLQNGFSGAISIYAAFGGNPDTVRTLQVLLDTTIGIRKAVDTYTQTIELAGSSALLTMGANIALMGTCVGLIAVFSSMQEANQQMQFENKVMESLSKIAEQILALQRELREGLLNLDRRLTDGFDKVFDGMETLRLGIQTNQWKIEALDAAISNLSSRLDNSTIAVINRLDYLINREFVDFFNEYSAYSSKFNKELSVDDFEHVILKFDSFIGNSKQSILSGAKIQSIETFLEEIYAMEMVGDFSQWTAHINTYRSLLRITSQESVGPSEVCNPMHWSFGARKLIDIHLNNAPSRKIPIETLEMFIAEGKTFLEETARNSCSHYPETQSTAEVLDFLISEQYYNAALKVQNKVIEIHGKRIASGGGHIDYLKTWDEFESAYDYVDEYYFLNNGQHVLPTNEAQFLTPEGVLAPAKWRVLNPQISPLKKGENQLIRGGVVSDRYYEPGESQFFYDVHPEVNASFEKPNEWPTVQLNDTIWKSFSAQQRRVALQCEDLGIGTIKIKYEVVFESLQIVNLCTIPTVFFEAIVGYPLVNFVIGLEKGGAFTPIGAARGFILPIPNDPAILKFMNVNNGVYGAARFDIKRYLTISGRVHFTSADDISPSMGEILVSVYRRTAAEIYNDLKLQANNADSELGKAIGQLSCCTNFIRGICGWLFSDILSRHDALRFSMSGAVKLPENISSHDVVEEERVPIPLLDKEFIRFMLAQMDDDPMSWSPYCTLQGIAELAGSSMLLFREAVQHAISIPVEERIGYSAIEAIFNDLVAYKKLLIHDHLI